MSMDDAAPSAFSSGFERRTAEMIERLRQAELTLAGLLPPDASTRASASDQRG